MHECMHVAWMSMVGEFVHSTVVRVCSGFYIIAGLGVVITRGL